MSLWCYVPEVVCDLMPPHSMLQVGIGAFVVNSKKEVLVVQERFGPLKGTVRFVFSAPEHHLYGRYKALLMSTYSA